MIKKFLRKYSFIFIGILGIILINLGLNPLLHCSLPIKWYIILNINLLIAILSALFLVAINKKNKGRILEVLGFLFLIIIISFSKGYFNFWEIYSEASSDSLFYQSIQLNFPETEKHVNYDSYFEYLSGTKRWTLMFRTYLLNGLAFLIIFFTGNWLRGKITSRYKEPKENTNLLDK